MSQLSVVLLTSSQHPTLGAFILHSGCKLSIYKNLDEFLVKAVSEKFDVLLCDEKFLAEENVEDRLLRLLQRNRELQLYTLSKNVKYHKLESMGAFHPDDLSSIKGMITFLIKIKNQGSGQSSSDASESFNDEEIVIVDEETPDSNESSEIIFEAESLQRCQNLDDLGKGLVKSLEAVAPQKRALIFKYLPNYCSLVVLGGSGFKSPQKYNGMGLNFSSAKDFNPKLHLSRLESVPAFKKIIDKAFGGSGSEMLTVAVEGVPRLLLVLEGRKTDDSYLHAKMLSLLAEEKANHIIMKTLYYNIKVQDELTGTLSREHFFERMQDEYMRARRIFLPVTTVVFEIDNFSKIKETYNTQRVNTLLKMVAKVLKDSVRHNDFVGRLSEDRFVVLFPHMSLPNAKVKIDKLRTVLSQTKFFSDMKDGLTVSISSSFLTYPQFSHSADEGLLSLENSLDQNTFDDATIELTAREGFRPDFEEIELPFSRLGNKEEPKDKVDVESKTGLEIGKTD